MFSGVPQCPKLPLWELCTIHELIPASLAINTSELLMRFCVIGITHEILCNLAKILGKSPIFYPHSDFNSSMCTSSTNCIGQIAAVASGEADAGLGSYSYRFHRHENVDYSFPIFRLKFVYAIGQQPWSRHQTQSFSLGFDFITLWFILGVFLINVARAVLAQRQWKKTGSLFRISVFFEIFEECTGNPNLKSSRNRLIWFLPFSFLFWIFSAGFSYQTLLQLKTKIIFSNLDELSNLIREGTQITSSVFSSFYSLGYDAETNIYWIFSQCTHTQTDRQLMICPNSVYTAWLRRNLCAPCKFREIHIGS